MTASVEILTNRKENVMSVPLAAVTTRNPNELASQEQSQGGPPSNSNNRATEEKKDITKKKEDKVVVFVNDAGVAKMVEVKTGISDYENIEIVSGVNDSTEVITGPFLAVSKRLKDGDKIRVKPKEESTNKASN
jgi:HlyD family secretion protein